jgi:hypothetical protein
MKKVILTSLAVLMFLGIGMVVATNDQTGNGAPSGPHYNLNIIGMKSPKNVDPDPGTSNGKRIFVLLGGKTEEETKSTRIWLTEGDFDVIDYDGTDGEATFQLPNPDPENDGITTYSVYIRGLGKPGGKAKITPGFVDENGDEWYSVMSVTVERKNGQSKFVNVSKELLYVYVDMDGNGSTERYPLFSNELWDFFWQYDNNGLKLCQLRFYEIPTDVN